MAPRKGWSSLSDAQRKRYISSGASGRLNGDYLDASEVRSYYEQGGDLGGGRGHGVYDNQGHRRLRPAWAAPEGPTARAKVSLLRDDDRAALNKWRRSRAYPKWLPRSPETFSADVAAILSEVDRGPRDWTNVQVRNKGNGRYALRITLRRRSQIFETTLPDDRALRELGTLLNDSSRLYLARGSAQKKLQQQWSTTGGKPLHINVDTDGYDGPPEPDTDRLAPLVKPPRGPAALPVKKVAKPVKKATKKAAPKKPVKKATKKVAKKVVTRRKRANNLRDVFSELVDLRSLLAPLGTVAKDLDPQLLKRLDQLTKDVERLIG